MPLYDSPLPDDSPTRARLCPVSVRLYNALRDARDLIRGYLQSFDDPEAHCTYAGLMRVLRDAETLARGVMPPTVLRRIVSDTADSLEIAAVRRESGPNTPMPRYPFEVLYEIDREDQTKKG